MIPSDEHPDAVLFRRLSARHKEREADARRDLAAHRRDLIKTAAALEEAYDEIRPPQYQFRVGRFGEVISLTTLGVAEVVVAESVVQSLGLTATATDLVAVAVGGTATGLAWLVGHEWAIAHDAQAAVAGRRGWLRLACGTAGAFLAANLGVRIYYGILTEEVGRLGSGLVAPLLSGSLLTVVTAALMVVAAFVTAHAESGKEAQLRIQLKRVRANLRSLENRVGVVEPQTARDGPQRPGENGDSRPPNSGSR